jgi:hypothetical protein
MISMTSPTCWICPDRHGGSWPWQSPIWPSQCAYAHDPVWTNLHESGDHHHRLLGGVATHLPGSRSALGRSRGLASGDRRRYLGGERLAGAPSILPGCERLSGQPLTATRVPAQRRTHLRLDRHGGLPSPAPRCTQSTELHPVPGGIDDSALATADCEWAECLPHTGRLAKA